jgi:hypothetical protein
MGAFVRATRNGQFNESAQRLVNEGINHYQGLRETLSRMTGHRGYNTYFESWTPSLMEDETEENNLNELFVQETLDPRIESVMPILNKLQKKVAEMKEVGELSEWADSLTEAPGAETLAHNVRTDDKNLRALDLEESEDDIDDPVVSAITRRIIRQHPELLKHGPDKVLAAIADVADFVGDVEEIGSSDVSGWVKQVERSLGSMDEGILDTVKKAGSKVFDKLGGGNEEDLIRKLQKDAGVTTTGKKPEFDVKAKELARSNPSDPVGNFTKGGKDLGIFKEEDMDEGMFDKVKDAVKKVGGKVLDKLGHGSDEELLKKIQKDAGIPASAQHGKPNMGHAKDEERLEELSPATIQSAAAKRDTQQPDDMSQATQRKDPMVHATNRINMNTKVAEEEVDESGLQAYLGNKKYGKDGMDALRKAGQDHASEKKMQNIRAKYSNKEEVAEDGEFAGDYATGEAGQWRNKGPKANKPATIGDLVGEGQEDLDVIKRLISK